MWHCMSMALKILFHPYSPQSLFSKQGEFALIQNNGSVCDWNVILLLITNSHCFFFFCSAKVHRRKKTSGGRNIWREKKCNPTYVFRSKLKRWQIFSFSKQTVSTYCTSDEVHAERCVGTVYGCLLLWSLWNWNEYIIFLLWYIFIAFISHLDSFAWRTIKALGMNEWMNKQMNFFLK